MELMQFFQLLKIPIINKLIVTFVKQYVYALGVAIILSFILILTVVGFGYAQIYLIHPIVEHFLQEILA